MKRWSKPFVSLCAVLSMAACRSTPHEEAPHLYVVKSSGDGAVATGAAVPVDATPAVAPTPTPTPAAAPAGTAVTSAAVPKAVAAASPAGSPAAGGNAGGSAAPLPPVPAPATERYGVALQAMKAGNVADAELGFKELAVAYPDLPGPQLNLGLLYAQTARLAEAESEFKAVLERDPANTIAGNELGIVERKMGKFADAEAAYQHTIAADPNYAPAYLNLGVLYDLYLAEPQKALEQLEHYVQLAGENKQVAGWVAELRKRVASPAAKKDPA